MTDTTIVNKLAEVLSEAVRTARINAEKSTADINTIVEHLSPELRLWVRDGAIVALVALQYGVRLDTLKSTVPRNADGSTSRIVGAVIDKLKLAL
jgi:hypothetical protein